MRNRLPPEQPIEKFTPYPNFVTIPTCILFAFTVTWLINYESSISESEPKTRTTEAVDYERGEVDEVFYQRSE